MIKGIHYFSGLTLAAYIGLHVLNHLLILHSEAMHLRFMKGARRLYRRPAVEGVLLTAVAVQILTGIPLVLQKWPRAEGWFDGLHIGTGLYLAFFLTNHVRAVLVGRLRLHLDTDLYYGAGVMNMWPRKLFFIPYYALALFSFFGHVASIHRIKAQQFVSAAAAEHQAIGILIVGGVVTFLVITRMSRLHLPVGMTGRGETDTRDEAGVR